MRFTKPLQAQISAATTNGYAALQTITKPNGLDYAAVGRLIQHCTDRRLLLQGKQLHARLVLSATAPDNFLASKLITLYSKTKQLRDAHQVFDEIPHRNTFSWNALLIGYSSQNRHLETLKLFSTFLSSLSALAKPDNFTITCVLKALSSLLPDAKLAEMIHSFVKKNGFVSDVFVVNPLVTCYCRCDDIVSARNLFDEMPDRDIVSWNSMIGGYSQGGFYEDCKALFRDMLRLENVRPDEVTVVSVLQACAQPNDLVLGMDVHQFVVESKIEMDLTVCNTLISLYAKSGSIDYARDLFEEMSERDEVTYSAIISGYMANGFVDKAMDLFCKMEKPALSAWNAVISGNLDIDDIKTEIIG
ncbi:hypothetical protein RJ639_008997 [Escallonia herrerae]|uniref:Pentatricopeptide repeat-containing protein n=1 Tax=Escallonia herrerae TaxID=1293975 RepID=A0AA89AS32_9ASTE|nr:hypothetical protein RJ639_008997 [Escallonia herrerae]